MLVPTRKVVLSMSSSSIAAVGGSAFVVLVSVAQPRRLAIVQIVLTLISSSRALSRPRARHPKSVLSRLCWLLTVNMLSVVTSTILN